MRDSIDGGLNRLPTIDRESTKSATAARSRPYNY
jgi:hypothetical protein